MNRTEMNIGGRSAGEGILGVDGGLGGDAVGVVEALFGVGGFDFGVNLGAVWSLRLGCGPAWAVLLPGLPSLVLAL